MPDPAELVFVIPTYRLRDVRETVEKYDEVFWNSGHSPRIVVFDDSIIASHGKYYRLLEATRTRGELFYVGPAEKEAFTAFLRRRREPPQTEDSGDPHARERPQHRVRLRGRGHGP